LRRDVSLKKKQEPYFEKVFFLLEIETYFRRALLKRNLKLYNESECAMMYESVSALYCTRVSTMGWLRLVRSFKLYVSFAEYRLFYRALLQKRPVI